MQIPDQAEAHEPPAPAGLAVFDDPERLLEQLAALPEPRREAPAGIGLRELRHDVEKELAVLRLLLERLEVGPGGETDLEAARAQIDAIAAVLASAAEPFTDDEVDVAELARDVSSTLSAVHAGGAIELDVPAGPETPRVQGDRGLLRRAVVNLLDNARAAAPTGRIRVRVRTYASGAALEVEDDGSGSPRRGGSGLGLPIVRYVAARHGGTASFAASALGGCKARLLLPSGGHR